MEKKISLLIMAAGKSNRYGAMKQTESVGPNGEWLMEYSISDALIEGFSKVVIVIRQDHEDFFSRKISLIRKKIPLEIVYQEIPEGRTKPWGTAEAVLCTREKIQQPFLVINADDFYGRKTFELASNFLKNSSDQKLFAMAGYELKRTLLGSSKGANEAEASKPVSRAECSVDAMGFLKSITERQVISDKEGIYFLEDDRRKFLSPQTIVSMNCWALQPSFFLKAQNLFSEFKLHGESGDEFSLPGVIQQLIQKDEVKVHVIKTDATWFGMTYNEDKEFVSERIAELVQQKIYPRGLWDS